MYTYWAELSSAQFKVNKGFLLVFSLLIILFIADLLHVPGTLPSSSGVNPIPISTSQP